MPYPSCECEFFDQGNFGRWQAGEPQMLQLLVELGVISWIRHRFMDSPLRAALFQVALGGLLVFLAGILIGRS